MLAKGQQLVLRHRLRLPLPLPHCRQLAYAHPNIPENWNPALNSETLLGVLASDARLAVRALRDWCQALDLEFVMPTLREVRRANEQTCRGRRVFKGA